MKKIWVFVFLTILLFPTITPLLRGDFFNFSDEPNISLIYEMNRALEAGHFPPRWIPDVSYTFGHPLFNFYYPLPFFLSALIFQISGSLITSIKIYFLLTVVISCWAMYLLLKKHTTNFLAFCGALLYVYTPYRAVDLYVRGAIGELTAFAFVPLVMLSIYKLYEKQSLKNIGFLGIVTALFILSHNLALMIFFPWFLMYAFYLFLKNNKNKKFIKTFSLSILLGILISFFWLFPAVTEKQYLFSQTPFNYTDHFPFIKQLLYSPFRYGASLPGPYDDISMQIGITNLLLVLVTVRFFWVTSKKINKTLAIFCLTAFGFAIFLMNIRSSFLWELFSLSPYFQFPWRILMFTTFITAFMIVFVRSRLIGVILLLIAFINTFTYFVPSGFFNPVDDYYMKRFFADRSLTGKSAESSEYKNYSEDYLLLPVWVKERPDKLPYAKIESDSAWIKSLNEISPYKYEANFTATNDSDVTINNYYYPGWSVYVNGKKVSTNPLEPYGNIGIKVLKGEGQIKVVWEETPRRKLANYVSLLSLILALVFIFPFNKTADE